MLEGCSRDVASCWRICFPVPNWRESDDGLRPRNPVALRSQNVAETSVWLDGLWIGPYGVVVVVTKTRSLTLQHPHRAPMSNADRSCFPTALNGEPHAPTAADCPDRAGGS